MNKPARVQLQGHTSRKTQILNGVPQGGVLSPTLFLIYINDITENIPRSVHSSLYADDLALWSSAKYVQIANSCMQTALRSLESWSSKWLLKINESKTTYTNFTLSTKRQEATLVLNGKALRADETPSYLGITLDRRLTWKPHLNKAQARAKLRLGIMRKLAGTTWGADMNVLKKLYVGRVRPVLEYGMSAWATTSQTNFEKVQRVQNCAARIITGSLRSTPINRYSPFHLYNVQIQMQPRRHGKVQLWQS